MLTTTEIDLLARDIATFTSDGLYSPAEVFTDYGLDEHTFADLEATTEYQTAFNRHRNAIGDTPTDLVRARARLMAGSGLRRVFEIATDPKSKPADALKANALLAELGDVKPKPEQQFSGMVLNVNFGSASLPATPAIIIDNDTQDVITDGTAN